MEIGSLNNILNEAAKRHNRGIINSATSVYKHLILSKIAPNNYAASHWSDEIDIYSEQLKASMAVKKGSDTLNSNDIKTLKDNIDVIYQQAKNEARDESSTVHDPIPFDKIPEDPEWSIDDILTKDKTELIPGIVLGGRRLKQMARAEQEAKMKNKKRRR